MMAKKLFLIMGLALPDIIIASASKQPGQKNESRTSACHSETHEHFRHAFANCMKMCRKYNDPNFCKRRCKPDGDHAAIIQKEVQQGHHGIAALFQSPASEK